MNAPTDMSSVIVPKSDQINADDLIGGDMTITIREVHIRGGQEQPVSIYFDGSDKAYRPCKSMSRVLVAAWGPDAKQYVGRTLQLYRDPTVKWAGMEVGGIRIRAMSHIDNAMTMALTATKGSRKPFTVKPLNAPAPKPDDPAAKWAAAYIANVQNKTGDALAAFIAEKAAKLAELREKRPELAAEIDLALAEAGITNQPATGDGSAAADPSTPAEHVADSAAEGPADADRGENDTLRATADRLIAEARGQELLADLKAFEGGTEFTDAYATLDDDLKLEVDGEIAACRRKLVGEG